MRLVIFALTLGLSQTTLAGVGSSGGGMAVVCRAPDGTLGSVELLDHYEARLQPGKTLLRPTGDLDQDYLRMVTNTYRLQGTSLKVDPDFSRRNLRRFLAIIKWVSDEEVLPFLGDQGETPELPEGCELEQLAIFYDGIAESVRIKQSLWLAMDTLNRAALVYHELFYKLERIHREVNSQSTRSYVRQILTVSGSLPARVGVEDATYRCWAFDGNDHYGTVFYLFQEKNELGTEDITLQFTQLLGRSLLTKSTIHIPNLLFDFEKEFNRDVRRILLHAPEGALERQERVRLVSEHREDWEILLKYLPGEPITLTLIQDGSPVATSMLQSCSPAD